jgi:hypothetical protein
MSFTRMWAVISAGAERPGDVYDKKEDALKRAQEIARNKGTGLTVENRTAPYKKKNPIGNRCKRREPPNTKNYRRRLLQ